MRRSPGRDGWWSEHPVDRARRTRVGGSRRSGRRARRPATPSSDRRRSPSPGDARAGRRTARRTKWRSPAPGRAAERSSGSPDRSWRRASRRASDGDRTEHVLVGAARFGVAGRVLRAAPVPRPVTVGVGDDQADARVAGRRLDLAADRRCTGRPSSASSSPAAAASTRPSPDPADTTSSAARARTMPPGSSIGASSTGTSGAPTRGSPTARSSVIGTSGGSGTSSPYGSSAPTPGAPATLSRTISGRAVRNRSNARSLVSQIVSTPSSRATGATASGSSTPSWIRSSRAYSRSIAPGEPSGSRSRVTSGLTVRPGSGWSTVYPHR